MVIVPYLPEGTLNPVLLGSEVPTEVPSCPSGAFHFQPLNSYPVSGAQPEGSFQSVFPAETVTSSVSGLVAAPFDQTTLNSPAEMGPQVIPVRVKPSPSIRPAFAFEVLNIGKSASPFLRQMVTPFVGSLALMVTVFEPEISIVPSGVSPVFSATMSLVIRIVSPFSDAEICFRKLSQESASRVVAA